MASDRIARVRSYRDVSWYVLLPVLSNDDAVRFVALDTGPRATVAERLAQRVLEVEAEAAGVGVESILAMAPGRKRRDLHDDLTSEWLGSDSCGCGGTHILPFVG